jgi:hypothetical protein
LKLPDQRTFWICGFLLLAGFGLFSATSRAQELRFESAGTRFGFHPDGANAHFYEVDATANWNLPWSWELGSSWRLQSRFDFSAGWLGESSANAAVGTAGPTLIAILKTFPLSFETGVSPTVLSRSNFPSKDFGDLFQFTSHVGFGFDITSGMRVGYRFQHMSNAGLSRHNPGLNLHMISVNFLF